MSQALPEMSVILCAYTEARWDALVAAVHSVQGQSHPPYELIVVIDHNQPLCERVRTSIPGIKLLQNREARGLSGARNTGIAAARGSVIAFMDEDAVAAPDWLAHLGRAYADQHVIGAGGAIHPDWLEQRPRWFPDEFDWVVGCTYRGMPTSARPVRNLIGCNMSFRRELFAAVGGFRSGIGRVGTRPVGCEETEFCIRARQSQPHCILLYDPAAQVFHRVPSDRASWRYFFSRCYAEGLSKALVTQSVGTQDGLASERTYALQTLPGGCVRNVAHTFSAGDPGGLFKAGAIIAGLATTTAGYVAGNLAQGSARIVTPDRGDSMQFTSNGLDFVPARILEVDIGEPLPAIPALDSQTGQQYRRAIALVRWQKQPIGRVELALPADGLSAEAYAHQIWQALEPDIRAHVAQDGSSAELRLTADGLACPAKTAYPMPVETAPLVSIVIATRDRTASLATCLQSLVAQDYPNYEIIVVDNAPRTTATADFIKQAYGDVARMRYVREDRPGLAVAHNCGLHSVTGSIVAFTDDDVVVDAHWLTAIVQAFNAADNVGCVTGMIFPAELETPAQEWIEQYGGFNKGFRQRIFDLDQYRADSPLYPYTAGIFGSGANMAFKTEVLQRMGGFDPALGAGSKGVGGDDLAAFFAVVTQGYRLVYEPGAIVYHWHRRDYAGLQKQAYGYGVGLAAYLTKTLVDNPGRLFDFVRKIPPGLSYIFDPQSPKNRKKQANYPGELTSAERRGMLYGPFAYLRSRWHVQTSTQQHNTPPGSAVPSSDVV